MSETPTSRYHPIIIALAPAALAAAMVAHPFIEGRLPNDAAVAEAVAAGTTRWGVVHLAAGVASALVILAFLALRDRLRGPADARLTTLGVPAIVIGSTLFVMLPGMELAALAAAETGDVAEIAAAQAALQRWFVPVLISSGIIFAVGVFTFIVGITRAGILSRPATALVVGALAVMALSRLVPLAAVQFYVQSAAGLLAFWPLAYHLWTQPTSPAATRPGRAHTVTS